MIFATAAIAAGFVAQPAAAADFTFDVPLRIANLPAIETVRVECFVSRIEAGGAYQAAERNVLGRGDATVPISGGNFDGTVTVEVENRSISPSTEVRSYSCSQTAVGTARTGVRFAASPGNYQEAYETATGATLDRVVPRVQANLP
jgi:hypothetical protein